MNTLPENCPFPRSAARHPGYLLIAMGLLGAIAVLLAFMKFVLKCDVSVIANSERRRSLRSGGR